MTDVKIKLLRPGAVMPVKATKGSAGYDVFIPEDTVITKPRQLVPLGFAMKLPHGYCAKIRPRSGQSSKGMSAVHVSSPSRFDADVICGLVDEDYRGEVHLIIHKSDPRPMTLCKGTRIAQMTIEAVPDAELVETHEDFDATQRGAGGLGHTGTERIFYSYDV